MLLASLLVPARAENYLIIVADDLGADKIGRFADDDPAHPAAPSFLPVTPTIDNLADHGVSFTQAWATPSCTPTRASIHTGVYPFRHGFGKAIPDSDPGIDPDLYLDVNGDPDQLLGVLFEEAGYATAAFGKWHLGTANVNNSTTLPSTNFYNVAPHPTRLGFATFFGTIGGLVDDHYFHWKRWLWDPTRAPGPLGTYKVSTTHTTERTTDEAIEWINAQTGPWLAFVNYHAPHSDGANTWNEDDLPASCPLVTCANGACTAEDTVREVYQKLVECLDHDLKRLTTSIDLTDTIVVFLGDNGTPADVMETGYDAYGGKGTVDETGIRVSLAIADGDALLGGVGRIPEGVEVDAPVLALDLHASLLEDADIATVLGRTLATTDSLSFWDCLDGSPTNCGRTVKYRYTEKFDVVAQEAIGAVGFGANKMTVTFDPTGGCVDLAYYDLNGAWHRPTTLSGTAEADLLDWFTTNVRGQEPWVSLLDPTCLP